MAEGAVDYGKQLLDKLRASVPDAVSLEIKPDRDNDEEIFLLVGRPNDLISQASLLLAIRQLVENKDIGTFLGESYEDKVIYQVPTDSLSIQVHYRLVQTPPWESYKIWEHPKLIGRNSLPRPCVTIPNVDKSIATNWNLIKSTAGGPRGYLWGPYYAVARLINKKGDYISKGGVMKVYGASEAVAEQRLEAFMKLTNYKNYTTTSGREVQDKGVRAKDKGLQKPEIRVYPAFYVIHNSRLVQRVNEQVATQGRKGRSTKAGKKLSKTRKIPLWWDAVSPEVQLIINQMADND
jgi:hypothetical protein